MDEKLADELIAAEAYFRKNMGDQWNNQDACMMTIAYAIAKGSGDRMYIEVKK